MTETKADIRRNPPHLYERLTGPNLSAQCANASNSGGTSADQQQSGWHAQCRYAVWSPGTPATKSPKGPRGLWVTCDCDCHTGNPKCAECQRATDLREDQPTCVDVEDCAAYQAARTAQNPLTPVLREVRAAAAAEKSRKTAERAERRPATDPDGAPVTRRERAPRTVRPARPTSGRCIHCGAPTKGGLFVAGHDAKLKGILLGAAKSGDVEALAEIVYRGWLKDSRVFDPKVLTKAKALAAHDQADALVGRRVAERMDPPAKPAKKSRAKATKP